MPINNHYDEKKIVEAIAEALDQFYTSLLHKLDDLDILTIMKKKNPYLYRAKAMQNASDIVKSVLDAFISSSEETIFGNCFFEPIAIAASNGQKSIAEGIDIMIQNDNTIYAIAVKSGTAVFNSDSKKKQKQNFERSAHLAQQARKAYMPIIGYSYGKKNKPKRATPQIYIELAGKYFWSELTGDENFYLKIMQFMGKLPEQYIEQFKQSYDKAVNRLVREFTIYFCDDDGSINWEKLIEFNSGDVDIKRRRGGKKT